MVNRGVNGRGPRSRLVDAIFVMLLARPMRSGEIAGILGYSSRYVASYLSYWRKRGYVEYEGGYWHLTPLGRSYAGRIVAKAARRAIDERSPLPEALARLLRG